jgi:hypothetical protein
MTTAPILRTSRLAAVVAVLALAAGLVAVPAVPAAALHQNCGKDFTGVHFGDYPSGVRSNGHPDPKAPLSAFNPAWSGKGGVTADLELTKYTIERLEKGLEVAAKIWSAGDDPLSKAVGFDLTIIKLVTHVTKVALDAGITHRNATSDDINSCGSVFLGDTIDLLWVAQLEEDLLDYGAALAGVDTSPGRRTAGSTIHLLPNDGSHEWTPDGSIYKDRPGHDSETLKAIGFNDGMLDEPHIGVAVVVRNSIAHLHANGVPVGNARQQWKQAMGHMRNGNVREAYAGFAEAYYTAVTAGTSSTASGTISSGH